MGALHLCVCVGLVLVVIPKLDARNVKLIPAETKTITTNGATHEISRYILVPNDQNNGNGAKTIADAIRLQIASKNGVDKAQSETINVKSDDVKDLNEINRVNNDNAKEAKYRNVHDLIKTIQIMHTKHDTDGGNIKSEIPASVNYHHITGSHIKNNDNHSNHANTEVIGNWHKIKNNGQGTVEHTRVMLNFKPQQKVAQSKVIYIKHNNEGKEQTNLKKSALKMHFQGQTVQAGSRGGFGLNVDENTAKDGTLSKITKIKYSELPIKWDLLKSGDKGDLTTIGINKTFTIPGKRGRFKLLHENDDDYNVDVAHEKHTIQHYPLPKHKTVTHYYASKYTVGRTVLGQDEKNDLSLRLHKNGSNRGGSSEVAHETTLDKNNNLNIGLLGSYSNEHGDLNVNNDVNNDGEIIIHRSNPKISSAPAHAINVIKSNSMYTNTGVVNLQAETPPKHEENTFLINKNSDEKKQNVHLDTDVSNDAPVHNSQIEQKIVDSHDTQSLEDTDLENSSKVVSSNDNLDSNVLIENRNNVGDTEPTAIDKIDGDLSQSNPNEIVFLPQDNSHSAESYEKHDMELENDNSITPDATDLLTSSEHDIVKDSTTENQNYATSIENTTKGHHLDDENDKIENIEDVSQTNPNEINFPLEDNIHSAESYEVHDAETENANTITNTDTPDATDLSTEHDIVKNSSIENLNSVTSNEQITEGHGQDDVSDEKIAETDSQVINQDHATLIASETSVSHESEELAEPTTEFTTKLSKDNEEPITEVSNNNLETEPNESVENEEPKIEDAIEHSTEELGKYDENTQSLSSVPIESESSVSDEVKEPKINYNYLFEELGNENNVTVPETDNTVVSTEKTVSTSGESNINNASQYDATEHSSEELGIDENPAVPERDNKLESNKGTVPTAVSVETEAPINYVSESSYEVQGNHNNINVTETDNTPVSTIKSVPISDETRASSESEEITQETPVDEEAPVAENENKLDDVVETLPVDKTSGSDETKKLSSESLESDNNVIVPTTHVSNESDELVVTEADHNDVYNIETTFKAEDTSINDESGEPETDDTTDISSEILGYVDEDNVSKTDEVEDKEKAVLTVESTSASNETEESENNDLAVPEDYLSVEHSEEDANKFTPAESIELENPKDISGSLPIANDEGVPITDDHVGSTPQQTSEYRDIEHPAISNDEALTPDFTDLPANDLSEPNTESDQLVLTPDEIIQLENLHEQSLENTEATDSLNSPSEMTSDEIEVPKHIPEPEMTNDYDSDEYEVIEPKANDKESSKEYPYEEADLNDREEAAREEHESTHPTVNVHLTRFPISGYQQASAPTYKNTYSNLANVYSLPNANSNQPNPYETSEQNFQYILGYLTSANVMQELRQKYAQGYGDKDKIRQMHIIGYLQNLGVHRISNEQYLILAQNVKQLEDVQNKAEIIDDDKADNQDISNQYYYMPYANVFPSVKTPKLNTVYIQRYLLQNVDVNAPNTAAQALSDRVLNIVTYLRKLRIPEYRISQFVTEVKNHLTPAAIQTYLNDCKNNVVTGLRQKIDTLAKQAMLRCTKCTPPVYALSYNYS